VRKVLFFLLFFSFVSCAINKKPYSIAIDKSWYATALNGQSNNLNGFIADVLLEIAKIKKIEISLIDANWDSIYDGLYKNQYQAIFSIIEPYNFNVAKFDFSKDFLKTGYVLVVAKDSKYTSLKDMKQTHVGYLTGDRSILILQKNKEIFDEEYVSIPMMLDDIKKLRIEGAVLSVIPGYRYVADLYQNDLKIIYPILDDQSIKIITLKNQNQKLMGILNSGLEELEKNHTLEKLKEKWGLPH
jgi:polar amino acid transport system substrate-binding protein